MGNGEASGRPRGPCGPFSARGFCPLLPAALQLLPPVWLFHFALCHSLSSLWPPSRAPYFVSASVHLSGCVSCPTRAKRTSASDEQPWLAGWLPGHRRSTAGLAGAEGAGESGGIYPLLQERGHLRGGNGYGNFQFSFPADQLRTRQQVAEVIQAPGLKSSIISIRHTETLYTPTLLGEGCTR